MNGYFLGLIIFAFVGSVILSLVPSGTSRRYVRFLCGLCSIGCIAFPLFELAGDGIDADGLSEIFEPAYRLEENGAEIYNKSINDATLEIAEQSLKNDIIKELSTKSEALDVEILMSENSDGFYIDDIYVTLYSSGYTLDPDKISEICQRQLKKGCTVVYK